MTREERDFAKSRIEYLLKISSFVFDEHDKEALEAAIQALSQEPTVTSTDEPMTMVYPTIVCDDVISRQAVIKLFNGNIGSEAALILHKVKQLPSVTQKSVLEQIRAEIIKQFEGCYLEEDMTDERKAEHKAYKNVLQIIDKYR